MENLDTKTRRLIVVGNGSLVIGLLMWNFARGQHWRWAHAASGFFIGLSLAINLAAVLKSRRRREPL